MPFDFELAHTIFNKLYGNQSHILDKQKERYTRLVTAFEQTFGKAEDLHFFSTPGRTEIGGNHTDHNHGRVLAGAINLDSIAVVRPNQSRKVNLYSRGYPECFEVGLEDLSLRQEEKGSTNALIRGIAARFKELGLTVDGFDAYIASDVLPGSGLSSSASIEVLIGTIFNTLFNEGKVARTSLAQIGQFAENEYFGKPCGLMDQMTCAVGGIIAIDFHHPSEPVVKKVDFNFSDHQYRLLVVDSGGTHADLTEDYAAVPEEMRSVAAALDADVCREIKLEQLLKHMHMLRTKVSDRAILRAYHFILDNERVIKQIDALESGELQYFLEMVRDSGDSSFKWLQNIYPIKNPHEQSVSLALALSEAYINRIGEGAARVHGGGFAGTIQVFLPEDALADYLKLMQPVFGEKAVDILNIRPLGTLHLNEYFD